MSDYRMVVLRSLVMVVMLAHLKKITGPTTVYLTGLLMMLSAWAWTTSCNTLTALELTLGFCSWTSAWRLTPSFREFSLSNSLRSWRLLPCVRGSPASWQAEHNKPGEITSHTWTVSIGSPQESVICPPLLSLFTTDCVSRDLSVKKYAVIRLMKTTSMMKTNYIKTQQQTTATCKFSKENHLCLSALTVAHFKNQNMGREKYRWLLTSWTNFNSICPRLWQAVKD